MMLAACWYTLLCISLNRMIGGGGSNFMSQADIDALTPERTANRVQGAKWVFVSEQSLMATMWDHERMYADHLRSFNICILPSQVPNAC